MNKEIWEALTESQQKFYTELSQGYAMGQMFTDHSAGWEAIQERIQEEIDEDDSAFANSIDGDGISVWGEFEDTLLEMFADTLDSLARDFLEAMIGAIWASQTGADKGE